jgi:hypothetical protein
LCSLKALARSKVYSAWKSAEKGDNSCGFSKMDALMSAVGVDKNIV